jgi:hypothetical protein
MEVQFDVVAVVMGMLLALLGGGAVIISGLRDLRRALRASGYPTVSGRVRTSEIQTRPGVRTFGGEGRYRAAITYWYAAQGRSWIGTRVAVGDRDFGPAWLARGRVQRYQPMTEVKVYYSPTDPSWAILEPGATWEQVQQIMVGVLLLCFGVWGILSLLR